MKKIIVARKYYPKNNIINFKKYEFIQTESFILPFEIFDKLKKKNKQSYKI